ncbi:MAG: RNase adapter RapZ [Firmicutes bacterium]|nr:RNase adapter RapZ [Bacillota bacterium]
MSDIRFIIITGLSGAGKSQALHTFEDLGFFCIDNLPPALIPKFAELCLQSEGKINRVALVTDIRGGEFFDHLAEALEDLETIGFAYQILFLEANDETLVRRFKETRRRHPLAPHGRVLEGIQAEKKRLEALKARAYLVLDTSDLTPQKFREQVVQLFAGDEKLGRMIITVVTFGFKYGVPLDADLVFDVRFLANPHYVDILRPLTGNDEEVKRFVLKSPVAQQFLRRLLGLVEFLLPHYVSEGKTQLTVAIGCTGGRHRSVVIGNRLTEFFRERDYVVLVEHRDIEKGEEELRREGKTFPKP